MPISPLPSAPSYRPASRIHATEPGYRRSRHERPSDRAAAVALTPAAATGPDGGVLTMPVSAAAFSGSRRLPSDRGLVDRGAGR